MLAFAISVINTVGFVELVRNTTEACTDTLALCTRCYLKKCADMAHLYMNVKKQLLQRRVPVANAADTSGARSRGPETEMSWTSARAAGVDPILPFQRASNASNHRHVVTAF